MAKTKIVVLSIFALLTEQENKNNKENNCTNGIAIFFINGF